MIFFIIFFVFKMNFQNDEFCIMLQDADFPDYYIDKHHPDDYKITEESFYELIYHRRTNHNRLLLRITIMINEYTFLPLTFICDTGAPSFIYISEFTRKCIKNRIKLDDSENEIIIVNGKKMPLSNSPSNHPDVNILGIRALSFFNLCLNYEDFYFKNLPDYI